MGKIKFHPFFIIYVFICVYFNWFNNVFYYVVTVVLHEYGHYFLARYYGYETKGIAFNLAGAGLKSNNIYRKKHDILISLAGPMVNLCLIILIVCFWWIVPSSYSYTLGFFYSNIAIMIFNLIPIYPLDGGRVIFALLNGKIKRKKLISLNKLVCIILSATLFVLFIISIFYDINFNLLFISIFLALNSVSYDKNIYFEKIIALNDKNEIKEIKYFKVNEFDKQKLIKYIKPNYFAIFVVFGENGKSHYKTQEELFFDR